MVDVVEVSAIVAAAGVMIGVAYYILDIRHQGKMRCLDVFMRFYEIWGSEDINKAHRRINVIKVKDHEPSSRSMVRCLVPKRLNLHRFGVT